MSATRGDKPSFYQYNFRVRCGLLSGSVGLCLGSTPDYESGGQEFESLRARHLCCWRRTDYFHDWLLPLGGCR
jgi:hypothetical protein